MIRILTTIAAAAFTLAAASCCCTSDSVAPGLRPLPQFQEIPAIQESQPAPIQATK